MNSNDLTFHLAGGPAQAWNQLQSAPAPAADLELSLVQGQALHGPEIVFVEGDVGELQLLQQTMGAGREFHVLDPSKDGLAQIASILEGRSDISALHLVTHGAEGKLDLGAITLDADTLDQHQAELEAIGRSLASDADILLYGCDVGAGEGRTFLDKLAAATGADIAASDDLTGSADRHGDWDLEVHVGSIDARPAVDSALAELYGEVLSLSGVTATFSTGAVNNFTSVGGYNTASQDVTYKVSGDASYVMTVDGQADGVYAYSNHIEVSDNNTETLVTFSFANSKVFTPSSLKVGNVVSNQAQTLIFKGYDASNSLVASQSLSLSAGLTSGTVSFTGFSSISTLKLSTSSNGNKLQWLYVDDMVFTTVTSPVTPPSITSATYNASTGVLAVTAANMTTGDTIAPSKLTLTGEGGTTYTLTTSNVTASSATAFSVTLNATDQAAVNQILNKNGTSSTSGTTFNLSAADDWDASVTSGDTSDATNTVTVSNVAVPTITSATYDGTTGVLTVTGTGFLKKTGGTNDIDVSKLTLSGQGGATRTLTTTSVEITSGTSFTVTLNAADKAAVNLLLNKTGTSSWDATTYNLAAAEDWAAGADAAVVVADLTGNGVTVSNPVLPSITSATYDASTGVLAVTASDMGSGDTIAVNKLTLTGEGGSTYTLTTSNVTASSASAFSITLNATDKAAVNQILNKNGTASTSGTTFNLGAVDDWDASRTGGDISDATNAVTVSNVAVPTITSATYDGSTGVLVVTGTGLLQKSGANNDIDVSKLTITGQGGGTYTLTTTSVDITSGTSFTVTLNTTDKAGVDALLNNAGTASVGGTTYNLAAAEDWAAGANAAVVVADLTGNGITVSNPATGIISATYNASTGVLAVSATGMTTGDTIAVNKLTLKGEGGSTYTLTTSNVTASSGTAFSVTLNATDKAAVNQILNKNGTSSTSGTTFNLAAADDWDANITAGDTSDATNALTVSNVAVPTITSATYDGGTGVLVVTGTGFLQKSGATNDIDVSKLTISGQGGGTRTLTTTSVEITSGTSFSVTLNGADKAAVDVLLNNAGTSSVGGTTYNLAAAEDWAAGADAAVVVADLTGNGITVSNPADTIAPTLAITSNVSALKAGETATITFTFSETPVGFAAGDVVTANGTLSGLAVTADPKVYTATFTPTANLASGNASITVASGTYTDAAGNNGGAGTTPAISIDTLVPNAPSTPDLNAASDSGTSNSDDVTNQTTPTFAGTAEAGATVKLYDTDGTTVIGTGTATGGSWSITTSALSQGAHTITAKATDAAGNTSAASAGLSVTIDTTAPTATIATAGFSADTGTSTSDFITNTAAQTISGTLSANMVADEIVEVSIDNGATWSTATTTVGSNAWTINKTLTGSSTLKVRVSDTAGNSGTTYSQAYTLDTTAPTATIATKSFSADTGSSSTDFITNTAAQTISGTTSATMVAGEFVEVSIDNGATWSTATTSVGSNTWTINKTLTGSDILKVRVSDTAGNTGTVSLQAYALDTTAPTTTIATAAFSADTGTSTSDFITSTAAQTISGTTSANMLPGEIVEVSIDNGSTWSTATTTVGSSAWTINKTLTGSSTLKVRVSDTAGNSGTTYSQAYTLDTTAPTATIATKSFSADTGSSSSDFITNTAAQTISGTTSANMVAGEFVEVSIDNGTTWSTATTSVGSNTWTINKTLTASSTLQVRVSDTAGNTGTVSSQAYTLDTTAPTTTIATAAFSADTGTSTSDFITKTAAQTISGTLSATMVAGEIVEVSIDNGSTWSTATTTVGSNAWTINKTLTGSSTLQARVSDTAGNSGTTYSQAYTLDTVAPTATVATAAFSADTGASSTDFITNTAAQTISGTLSANMVAGEFVEVSIDNGTTWSNATTAVGSSAWTINKTLTASNTLKVRVSDTAGNSGTTYSQAYTLDTTAPTATIATAAFSADTGSSSSDFITNTAAQTISGTTSANMVAGEFVEVSLDNGATWANATTTVGANTWSYTGTLGGSGTLKVRVSDTAGNSGAAYSQAYTLDTVAPTTTAATASFSADTGTSSSDFITKTTAQTISGTTSANLVAGEIVEVSIDNGATWSTATTAVGANTWTINKTLTGSSTLKVRVSDTAGNSSAALSQAYTLDTTAPAAPGTPVLASASDSGSSNSDGVTNVTAPTVTGTAEAGATVTLYDTDGTTVLGTATATGGNWSITTTTLSQGAHTLTAKATDTAGNVSTASSGLAVTIDTTAPAAPGTPVLASASDTGSSNSDRITSATTPTITGTAEAGATVTLYDTDGTTVLGTGTATGGNWSITSSTLAQGAHTLTAKATDTAGNTGVASSGLSVTIDTTAPAAPSTPVLAAASDTGSSSSDGITSATTPVITGTAEAGATVTLFDTDGTTVLGTATATGGNWSITTSALGQGAHTLTAKAKDAAGNVSTASSGLNITVDTTAPAAPGTPVLATASDTGTSNSDRITSATTPTITGTAEAGATVKLYDTDGTTVLGTATATGGNWSITTSTLGEGAHTLTAKATDAAGNTGPASAGLSVTIDSVAPATTIATAAFSADTGSSSTDFITNTAAQTISGTLSANMVAGEFVEVSLDNGASWANATTTVGANTWSYSGTLAASNTLKVRVADTAGNTGTVYSQAYVLDTVAPATTAATATFSADTGSSGTDFVTNTAAQTISGTTSANLVAGEIVEVSIDNGATWSTATTTVGANTWTINKTLAASNTLKVRVSDTAGNSSAALSQAYVLDTTAPAAPGTPALAAASDTGSSNSDKITSATTPTITGTAEAGATVRLYDTDGTTVLGTATATGGAWSITSNTLGEGAHTLTAKAADSAGNVSPASAGLAITIDTTAPTVTAVTSTTANGTYKAGDVIAIQLNLSEAVLVGGVPQLKLETGAVDQLVNYTSGSGTSTLTFNYTVQAGDTSADLDYFSATALGLNGGTLRDAAGNDLTLTLAAPGAAGSLGNAKNLVVDGIAPVLASGTVNGSVVVLNYTEASTLDGVNKPLPGAFAVTIAGNPVAVTGVAVDAAAKTVGLQLATAAGFGADVRVSYTDPTAGDDLNAIQDAAGNDAANVVAYQLTNTTAAPPPPPGSDNSLPTGGTIYVDGSAELEPERGRLLSFDTSSIRDTDGIVSGSFSFQWLRDGAAVTGATDSTYRLTVDDVGAQMAMLVRFTDGRANRESLVVTKAAKVGDADGVPTAVENLAPRVPPGAQGDGNGDGVQDAYQVSVASALVAGTSGRESYVTLVADSLRGAVDTTDGNAAVITAFTASALQGTQPANARLDALLKFTVEIGAAPSESFSAYLDGGLGARGFWLQETATGQWHNVTSAIQTQAGKTRIDFSAADGGAFDADGTVNGVISLVGVFADAPASIVGAVPVLGSGGFWF